MREILVIVAEEQQSQTETSVELIQRQVEKIISEDIKNFTYDALSVVDPHFWTAPSSSSGKYHPPEDNGEGGLVRHVVKGVAVIEQYAVRAKFSQRELDMAICAFLLHDSCKDGVVWNGRTDYSHGIIAAKWLEQFQLEDITAKEQIINAVRFHMAPWCYVVNPNEDRQYSREEMQANINEMARAMYPTRVEQSVRDADYWASRSSMSFFPGIPVDFRHDGPEE